MDPEYVSDVLQSLKTTDGGASSLMFDIMTLSDSESDDEVKALYDIEAKGGDDAIFTYDKLSKITTREPLNICIIVPITSEGRFLKILDHLGESKRINIIGVSSSLPRSVAINIALKYYIEVLDENPNNIVIFDDYLLPNWKILSALNAKLTPFHIGYNEGRFRLLSSNMYESFFGGCIVYETKQLIKLNGYAENDSKMLERVHNSDLMVYRVHRSELNVTEQRVKKLPSESELEAEPEFHANYSDITIDKETMKITIGEKVLELEVENDGKKLVIAEVS